MKQIELFLYSGWIIITIIFIILPLIGLYVTIDLILTLMFKLIYNLRPINNIKIEKELNETLKIWFNKQEKG